ncbi:AMP-binding protein [uncultured Thiothrix sp.]|uniref:AMP-binding protein n=1 Tax=uncultured Thiothrix sp. TaxID=223185 RepID=UPI002628C3A2|nr:AMP-binding protein [uncultured Thiothrix sp.]
MSNYPHTLTELLVYQSEQQPQGIALRYKQRGIWQTKTWKELSEVLEKLAAALIECGFGSDDSLVLITPPSSEALLLALAAQALGGKAIPLDPQLSNTELVTLLKHIDSPFLFIADTSWLQRIAAYRCELDVCIYAQGQDRINARYVLAYTELLESNRRVSAASFVAQANGTAFRFYRFNADHQPEQQSFSHEWLVTHAQQLVEHEQLYEQDEVLLTRAYAAPEQARYLLAPWLVAGFRLNFPELLETRDTDRREIGPSFILGKKSTWERLIQITEQRLPKPGTWARRWIDSSLQAPPSSWLKRLHYYTLGYWLVRRPLKDVLGISRTRVPLLIGEPLTPEAQAWFQRLGLDIRIYPEYQQWQVAPVKQESDKFLSPALYHLQWI